MNSTFQCCCIQLGGAQGWWGVGSSVGIPVAWLSLSATSSYRTRFLCISLLWGWGSRS